MKASSTSSNLHLILFHFFLLFSLLTFGLSQPTRRQQRQKPQQNQLPWADNYLKGVPITAELLAAVNQPFAQLTRFMADQPEKYGQLVLFRHFYPELSDCTAEDGSHLKFEVCSELLIFIEHLGFLPNEYLPPKGNHFIDRPLLEHDWLAFFLHHNETTQAETEEEEEEELTLVPDHLVTVPEELVPLLGDGQYLRDHLFKLRGQGDKILISYSSLKVEFLRNQAVYSSMTRRHRRQNAFREHDRTRPQRTATNRLRKLRVLYMLLTGFLQRGQPPVPLPAVVGSANDDDQTMMTGPSGNKRPLETEKEEEEAEDEEAIAQVGKLLKLQSGNEAHSADAQVMESGRLGGGTGKYSPLGLLLFLLFIAALLLFICYSVFTRCSGSSSGSSSLPQQMKQMKSSG